MRVLVVDQDSASNLGVTRSLRHLYTVDCVTNKADCLDLLRTSTFEVIVATERLEDGSGLELLGQISRKWPSVLRIFAAERERLQLLRGRLGPFQLFQTLTYPIDAEKLLATLQMAAAAHSSDSQEVELPSEVSDATGDTPDAAQTPSDAPFELSAPDEPLDVEQSDEFSEPRFARAGRAEPVSGRAEPVSAHAESLSRRGGPTIPRVGSPPVKLVSSGVPRARRVESAPRESDLAAKFPGSGTIGPRRGSSARASRGGRARAASIKPAPVRFPPLNRPAPLERNPPAEGDAALGRNPAADRNAAFGRNPPLGRNVALERSPPLDAPQMRSAAGDITEAAAMARAARTDYDSSADELDTKRLGTLVGGGVAVAALVVFLGFKMFSSKEEAPRLAPPVVTHAPEYPPEVTQLVAHTEDAFKADDFKAARVDIERLRQLAPSHPRLEFFQRLLATGTKGASSARGTASSKKSGTKGAGSSAAATKRVAASAPASHTDDGTSDASSGSGPAVPIVDALPESHSLVPESQELTPKSQGLAPETPIGVARESVVSAGTESAAAVGVGPAAVGAAPAAVGAESAAPAAGGSAAAQAPHTPATTAPSTRRGSAEPPPVIQEAKLIRRVNPDYPSAAKKDGIAGSVDLEITVSAQGAVENVSVIQATPPDMFNKSAIAAVRKWKYDPRFVDGLPSQAHLKVHLEFGPDK